MTNFRFFLFLTLCSLSGLFSSCVPDNNDDNLIVNKWINEEMVDYYYWYNKMPNIAPSNSTNPEDYFNSLLYTQEDKWSFITDDYEGLISEFEGTPSTMGYSPDFRLFTGTDKVFIIVEFVYRNSPAEKAGLKRGDIIIKINGEMMTTSNYADLYSGDSYTVTLGHFNGSGIYETSKTISMTAAVLDLDPVLCDTVYTKGSKKIGYIALSEFISHDPFVAKVQPVFEEFIQKGITDLIVDLRYNGGGEQNAAIWLASAIAPATTIASSSLIIQLYYNDKLQSLMDSKKESKFYFEKSPGVNFNLDKVYFLTAYGTASASELVMVGLEPYMNVIQVGDTTYGKYTGMWVIGDTHEPPRHNWGILPIVMKYANADGKTDFKDGLAPDYYVEDDLINAVPFGATYDPQIDEAISLITGTKAATIYHQPAPETQRLFTPKQDIKRNLIRFQ